MAGPYSTRGGFLGIGEEVTFGTPVARSNFLRLASATMTHSLERVPPSHLGTAGDVPNRRSLRIVTDNSEGRIEWLPAYDDSTLLLFEHALGGKATTGAGPYTHTFTLAAALPTGLTLEVAAGENDAGAQRSETFEGCKIGALELSIDAGGEMRAAIDVIAENAAARAAAGTPTYSSNGEIVEHADSGQFAWNAVNYDLLSMRLRLDNKLTRRPKLGSAQTQEPCRSDWIEVTIEVTLEYLNDNLHAAHLASTASDATITFTGAGNNSLAITLHNAEVVEQSDPVNAGGGIMQQTATFRGLSDGTDAGLAIVVINDSATSEAN